VYLSQRYFAPRYFAPRYWGGGAVNPYWRVLQAVAAVLADVSGCPAPSVREIPYVLGGADAVPLCLVCPGEGGEKLVRQTFKSGAWWDYPVLVLLISAGNRVLRAGVEARLQLREDVRQALFVPRLDATTTTVDAQCRPRAAADVRAALGTNYVVSGFEMTYRHVEARER
jgi:hypothetical protein